LVAAARWAAVQLGWPGLLVVRVRERGIASAQEAAFTSLQRLFKIRHPEQAKLVSAQSKDL